MSARERKENAREREEEEEEEEEEEGVPSCFFLQRVFLQLLTLFFVQRFALEIHANHSEVYFQPPSMDIRFFYVILYHSSYVGCFPFPLFAHFVLPLEK